MRDRTQRATTFQGVCWTINRRKCAYYNRSLRTRNLGSLQRLGKVQVIQLRMRCLRTHTHTHTTYEYMCEGITIPSPFVQNRNCHGWNATKSRPVLAPRSSSTARVNCRTFHGGKQNSPTKQKLSTVSVKKKLLYPTFWHNILRDRLLRVSTSDKRKNKNKNTGACLMIRVEEAVSQSEVDHDQGAVGLPLGKVRPDAFQGLLHRHEQKFLHLATRRDTHTRTRDDDVTWHDMTRHDMTGAGTAAQTSHVTYIWLGRILRHTLLTSLPAKNPFWFFTI